MTNVKFINTYRDALGEKDYQLLIDEKVYQYIPSMDSLMDDKTGQLTKRLNLPTNVLKAFHRAWNPAAYEGPHLTVDGLPDDTENPDSPLYYPAKPEGRSGGSHGKGRKAYPILHSAGGGSLGDESEYLVTRGVVSKRGGPFLYAFGVSCFPARYS